MFSFLLHLEAPLSNIHLNGRCVRGLVPPVGLAPCQWRDFVDSTASGARYQRDSLWIRIRRRPPLEQAALAIVAVVLVLAVAYLLLANRTPPASPPPPPTPVGVIVVAEQPVSLTAELPGRTTPYET